MSVLKKIMIMLVFCLLFSLLFIPYKSSFIFVETRTEHPSVHYLPFQSNAFQIRYTHSIHKTDVLETYLAREDNQIQLISMEYEDLAIGMPGYAEEGQRFEIKDGKYILHHDHYVLPSFTIFISTIETDLVFISDNKEIDLKEQLTKGKSYQFQVKKMSLYQQMRGVKMDDK